MHAYEPRKLAVDWRAQARACRAYLLPGCSLVMAVAQLAKYVRPEVARKQAELLELGFVAYCAAVQAGLAMYLLAR